MHMHRSKLSLLLSDEEASEDENSTMTISGRSVTIEQEPFMRADIAGAKSILERLLEKAAPAESSDRASLVSISHVTKNYNS